MGGLGHLALHIKVKDRLRAPGPLLGQTPPAGIAGPRRAFACRTVAHEIHVGVILIGRPVALEIVEEGRPVGFQTVNLEITQRKGKPVVDADQCGNVFA